MQSKPGDPRVGTKKAEKKTSRNNCFIDGWLGIKDNFGGLQVGLFTKRIDTHFVGEYVPLGE